MNNTLVKLTADIFIVTSKYTSKLHVIKHTKQIYIPDNYDYI